MSAHNYFATTDGKSIDTPWVLAQLQGTYFGKNRTLDQLTEQVRNSLCFGLMRRDYLNSGFPSHRDCPVGFCRVVTDYVSFGWLADFFIIPAERGNGLGHQLMQVVTEYHALRTVTLNLGTRDAHDFYAKFGFKRAETMARRPL